MNRLVLTLRYSLVALLVLELAQTEAAADEPAVSAENCSAGSFLFRCRLLEIEPAAGERVCAQLSICKSEATSHVWPLADEGVIEKVAQCDGVKTLADATHDHEGAGNAMRPTRAGKNGERRVGNNGNLL